MRCWLVYVLEALDMQEAHIAQVYLEVIMRRGELIPNSLRVALLPSCMLRPS